MAVAIFASGVLVVINLYKFKEKTKQFEDEVRELSERYEAQVADLVNRKNIEISNNKSLLDVLSQDVSKKRSFHLNSAITLQRALTTLELDTMEFCESFKKLPKDGEQRLKELNRIQSKYHNAIIKNSKDFYRNILDYTRNVIESHLNARNLPQKASLAIKQLDHPLQEGDNFDKCSVRTTFRDVVTYTETERETYKKPYTINGNSDFAHLSNIKVFRKSIYINNNLEGKEQHYAYKNESDGCLKYYDATVVVSIADYSCPGNAVLYGFLGCDTKKIDEHRGKEIFTRETGEILLSSAAVISIFLQHAGRKYSSLIDEKFFEKTCSNDVLNEVMLG